MKELLNIADIDVLNVNDSAATSRIIKSMSADSTVISVALPKANNSADEDYLRIHFKNALQQVQKDITPPNGMYSLADVLDQGVKGLEQTLFCYFNRDKTIIVLGEDTPFPFWTMISSNPLVIPLELSPRVPPVFWILSVNMDSSSLYEASNQSVEELDCPDLPNHISAAVGDDSLQKQLQLHGGGGQSQAIFHGHGGTADANVQKRKIEKYFSIVGNAVRRFHSQATHNPPLVVTGVKSTLDLFEDCFQFGSTAVAIEESSESNGNTQTALKELVKKIQTEQLSKTYMENQIRYELTKRRNLVSETPNTIASALDQGNIRSLFFDSRPQFWRRECKNAMEGNSNALERILKLNSQLVAAVRQGVDVRPMNSGLPLENDGIFAAAEQFFAIESSFQETQDSR